MIKRARQIESLDGLRGIAILMVMFLHFGEPRLQIKFVDSLLRAGTALGGIGVDLFFVLSGFLITGILLDTRHCSNYWSSFYSRRALRIFPLYYAFLFFAWAVFPSTADPGWLPVRADWWLYRVICPTGSYYIKGTG